MLRLLGTLETAKGDSFTDWNPSALQTWSQEAGLSPSHHTVSKMLAGWRSPNLTDPIHPRSKVKASRIHIPFQLSLTPSLTWHI